MSLARIHLSACLARCALAGLLLIPALSTEQELPIGPALNEQIVYIPAGQARLETTLFKPEGAGPFPLLIINHGKSLGQPHQQPRERFITMATTFVKRGYAVLVPMRQGFAGSSGSYPDHGCDMAANGRAQADDVRAVLRYAREQDWVDADHMIVAGQSYGGLATLALGVQDEPGVRGLLNFAGGLRDDERRCDWRAALETAFASFGAGNRQASLWFYGANDSLFGPALVARLHAAYVGAGGHADLHAYPAFKRDAHGLLASRDGPAIWWGPTAAFLERIGMPTRERYAVATPLAPPRTDFAAPDDANAIPYLSYNGRAAYRQFLTSYQPRAFAISPSGAWSWAEEGEEPEQRALAACQHHSPTPCRLYAVDNAVVWQPPGMSTAGGARDGQRLAR